MFVSTVVVLPRPAWLAPSCFTLCWFSPPRRGDGVKMGWDFSPASRGRAGMGLNFLDLPCPAPLPHPMLIKAIILKFSYFKTLLFEKTYQFSLFYSTQRGSLSIFCYVLYYEIFYCCDIILLNTCIILFSFC